MGVKKDALTKAIESTTEIRQNLIGIAEILEAVFCWKTADELREIINSLIKWQRETETRYL